MKATGREYAAALFRLAEENGTEQEIADGFTALSSVFEKTPDLMPFLSAPGIPKEKRLEVLGSAIEGEVDKSLFSCVCLLVEKGHISQFYDVCREYGKIFANAKKKVRVLIKSVVELTPTQKETLVKRLEKRFSRSVDVSYALDPSLIGGLVVETDGEILDGSVKTRLKTLKGALNNE